MPETVGKRVVGDQTACVGIIDNAKSNASVNADGVGTLVLGFTDGSRPAGVELDGAQGDFTPESPALATTRIGA